MTKLSLWKQERADSKPAALPSDCAAWGELSLAEMLYCALLPDAEAVREAAAPRPRSARFYAPGASLVSEALATSIFPLSVRRQAWAATGLPSVKAAAPS